MGTYSVCISSTVTIEECNAKKALAALQQNSIVASYIKNCKNLPKALHQLQYEYELVNGDINEIQFVGGKGGVSDLLWPTLSAFIKDGSEIIMEHDGERETITFEAGSYHQEKEFENNYEDEEDEFCEETEDFFEKIDRKQLNKNDIDQIFKKVGNVNFTDYDGNTPLIKLFFSIFHIDEDVDIDEHENIVFTIDEYTEELIDYLIEKKADINIVNDEGFSILSTAICNNFFDFSDKLISKGAELFPINGINIFHQAIENLDQQVVYFLLQKGVDSKQYKENILSIACAADDDENNRYQFVKFLVEKLNYDVNQLATKTIYSVYGELKSKLTPLMATVLTGDLEVVLYLLQQGARPDTEDSLGNTALHYCSGQTWAGGDGSVCWRPKDESHNIAKILLDLNFSHENGEPFAQINYLAGEPDGEYKAWHDK